MPRTVQQCTLFVVCGVFFLSDVVSGGSPPLRTPVIAMTTGFGMTTKATGTLNSMRTAEDQLFPSLDQLPVVSDIVAFYRDYKKEQEKEAMRKIGKVDTRLFPEEGCVVRGNSALCTVPIAVSEGGFNFQGSTTLGVRYQSEEDTLAETLYVDGFIKWKGSRPAAEPGMCFFLKKDEKGNTQFVPIAPGPEDKRKLPAELAVRFDDIKHRAGRLVAASVRAECKTGGATVADLPVGKFRIESS